MSGLPVVPKDVVDVLMGGLAVGFDVAASVVGLTVVVEVVVMMGGLAVGFDDVVELTVVPTDEVVVMVGGLAEDGAGEVVGDTVGFVVVSELTSLAMKARLALF